MSRTRGLALLVVVSMGFLLAARLPRVLAQAPCDTPVANAILCENSKPGNPDSEWDIVGAGDPSIQGFTTDISYNRGETAVFKIKTDAASYRLDIYRMGYYGGSGARRVASVNPSAPLPQNQPACLTDADTGLIDCGNWAVSASWSIPVDAVSGIYFARPVRADTGGASHIVFVVRDDAGRSDLFFQTSDTTWQAYNDYGGNSLYYGSAPSADGRAYKVSYNRPFSTRNQTGGFGTTNWVFHSEYPMVRWLEANGYNISYTSGMDSDRRGALIKNHKVFLSVGHDEYWSGNQRAGVEAARDAGVHLAFFSGNEVFWKTRWEPGIDGSGTPTRTLVTYKETKSGTKIDPDPAWTGTWRDPRLSPPADGGRPENALTGTVFTVNRGSAAIQEPAAYGKLRLWRNTSIADLAEGQTATLAPATLGYEWDEDLDNGFRPAGLMQLSATTVEVSERLVDFGNSFVPGIATHHLTLYRNGSGALVFSAGTVQWAWGLDAHHDNGVDVGSNQADPRMQQAMVNLFSDMGVQPGNLQSGLAPATASTDRTAPASRITSLQDGQNVDGGVPMTITGTAIDSGGVVGAVEVSVDGGATWHPATGRENWSYAWTPGEPGTTTVKTRAVDDSGNIESPGTGVTVTVPARTCPCTIWTPAATPATESTNDGQAVELGVKFRSDVDGSVLGIRFYKGNGNTGTHAGSLWTGDGTLLATATFMNETAAGWQPVLFSEPVAISANTTYVASYHTDTGHYAANGGYFATNGTSSYPLRALASGVDGGNGVFQYGASAFPTQSFNATNYWVDVIFSPGEGTARPAAVPR